MALPRYIHVDSDSRQSELRPEMVYQFISSAKTQNFNEGRNFGHDPKIRVNSTSLVDNHVFRKRGLSVSHEQKSPHYSLPLTTWFFKIHGIPFIVQHFPACRLRGQTFVAWKMLASLEVSQIFLLTISQNRDVLTRNMAKEMAGLCRNHCGLGHKKPTDITGPSRLLLFISPFGPYSSPGLTHVNFSVACLTGVTQTRNSTGPPLLQLAQNII